MAKDRIQINSDLQTNASQFHETIHDTSTDEIKTVDHPKGHSTSHSTTTIITNPYVCEPNGTSEKKDKVGTSSTTQTINDHPAKERKLQDYNTSQL